MTARRPSEVVFLTKPAVVSALMQRQAAAGFGFRNPMYRGALAGEYGIVELLPRVRIPAPMLWRDAPPTVVVIGDDGGISRGPKDFPQARRLLAWAERCMLHAAAGKDQHYAAVAEAGRTFRRVLLVETNTRAEPAWMGLLEQEQARRERAGIALLPTLFITVPADRPPHPA